MHLRKVTPHPQSKLIYSEYVLVYSTLCISEAHSAVEKLKMIFCNHWLNNHILFWNDLHYDVMFPIFNSQWLWVIKSKNSIIYLCVVGCVCTCKSAKFQEVNEIYWKEWRCHRENDKNNKNIDRGLWACDGLNVVSAQKHPAWVTYMQHLELPDVLLCQCHF